MRVLLLHLPIEFELTQEYTGDSLGLGYVAAVLRRDGHHVEILDGLVRNLKPEEVAREALAREFDCIGITANHYHHKVLIGTVRQLRKRKKDALIVVGGYLPTLSTHDLFAACPEIDIAVLGEGEQVISDLLGRIERGDEWRSTPGTACVSDGALTSNPAPPPIEDLDALPFPARDGILQALRERPVKLVRVLGKRGCCFRCSFCCIHSFYSLSGSTGPRMRRPESIVDEIESTLAATGISRIRFSDDDFIGPSEKTREHAVLVAQELKRRRLPITFDIECRADVLDEDILRQLKEAGLVEVFLGVESGSQSQLDRFNKRVTVEQNRRAIELLEKLDLRVCSGFIMFDPYVTVAELAENLQFLNETGIASEIDTSSPTRTAHKALTKLALYPGTALAKQAEADGLLTENGLKIEYVYKDRWVRLLCGAIRAWQVATKPARWLGLQRPLKSTSGAKR